MGYLLNFLSWHAWWLLNNIYQKICQPGKRKIVWDLISVTKYLKGWCREDWASGVQGKERRLWAQTQPQKVLSQHQQTMSHCEFDWDCPGRLQSVRPWRRPKASSKWPSWAGGLIRWPPDLPSHLSHLVILLLRFSHQNISYCFRNYKSAFQFLSRYSPPKASQQGKTNLKGFLNCLPHIQICSGHKLMHSDDQLYLGLNKQTSLSTAF